MIKKLFTAALAVGLSVTVFTTNVSAAPLIDSDLTSLPIFKNELLKTKEPAKPKPAEPVPVPPVTYAAVKGDNLTKIAAAQHTTWQRLWQKNGALTHPDVLKIGEVLTVPPDTEQLPERPLPTPAVAIATGAPVVPRGVIPGNGYTPGQCTWYVKNRRADLPNNLGNADTWVARAAAQGLPTGTAPRAGAAGMRKVGMHVVYVESVNADGTITISEMNYNYTPYATRTRTADPNDFLYIY